MPEKSSLTASRVPSGANSCRTVSSGPVGVAVEMVSTLPAGALSL
jgi:hypothetical protein